MSLGLPKNTPAQQAVARRYVYQLMGLMIVYAGALVLANRMIPRVASPVLKLGLAVLPALPIIGTLVAIGIFVMHTRDEYVRMLLVRQMLVATGLLLTVATIWGFTEDFGMAPHVPAYYATVLWFGGLGLGGCVNAIIERGRR